MRNLYLILALVFFVPESNNTYAQPAIGSLAPDWTFNDINKVSHHLYDYLDSGYMVILDVSATWCAPCWGFHLTHMGETLTNHYGPNGTIAAKKIKFFLIEGDRLTGSADLYGNTSASQGNWVAGANYPIIDTSGLNIDYAIDGYPTFIAICPNKRISFYSLGAGSNPITSEAFWVGLKNSCPAPSSTKDAALLSTEETVNICGSAVMLQNLWNQPITSAKIKMYKGGSLVATQPWTGNLQPFGVTGIPVWPGALPDGKGSLSYILEATGDGNALNDSVKSGYDIASLSGDKIKIEIKTDKYSFEDSWKLMDGNNLVASVEYGLYDTMHVYTYDYKVASGACLHFKLYDSYADGLTGGTSFTTIDDGYVKIYDGVNGNVLASIQGKDFTEQVVKHYRAAGFPADVQNVKTENSLSVYPNPAGDIVNIELLQNEKATIYITDIIGRQLLSTTAIPVSGKCKLQFSTANWAAGVYNICVRTSSSIQINKLVVSR